MTRIAGCSVACAATVLLAACGATAPEVSPAGSPDTTGVRSRPQLSVAVSFYPLEEIVSRVGGDRVEIVRLVEPGDNAHETELTAKTVEALGSSDALFYVSGGFQPSVEKAVEVMPESVRAVDLFLSEGIEHIAAGASDHADDAADSTKNDADGHEHSAGEDPHVWLDPAHMAAMANVTAAVLGELDPAGAPDYAANSTAYAAEMDSLGGELESRLARCGTRTLVTAHDAFGYLARRAGLETVSVAGLSPEDEPSARQLESIARTAEAAGVTTVFFEASLPEDLARTVATAIGADVDTLDALEGVTRGTLAAGGTYSSIMRDNIERIARSLGCR